MYSSIASNTASSLAAAAKVYYHFPYVRRRGSLPANCCTTWSWNPPRTRPMKGVTTHVSVPKSSTTWNTALNKNLDTCGAAPSPLRTLVNLCHTSREFARFLTNPGQSSSAAEIIHPKYLKEVTMSRERPYALKDLDVTALSSSARRHCFRSSPFFHFKVHQCIPFK